MKLLREYISTLLAEQAGEPRRMPLNIPVPDDLKDIHKMMKDAGMQLFIVGGAVRDTLMNKVPKDYDLATDAQPEAVIDLLRQDPDLRIDLTGKAFGVVRVKTPAGEEYEIAAFRTDLSKGRRPDAVEFTTIENDVKRRDLTINALFYDMDTGEVVDYVGGIDDIKDGVIRAVGNPAERFDEDKLRILRAVRFAGRTGSELDPETRDAILADNDLEEVSAERTTEEFVKGIQSAQDVTHFLGMMEDLGLFSQVFPGLQVGLSGGKTKDHVVQIAAMLSGNDPNKVKEQLQKMKYSRADAETIKHLIELQALKRESASNLKKEFKRLRVNPERVIEFAKLVDGFPPKKAKGFIKFAQSPPAVNPRDLMAKGLRGPDIGKAVKGAEEDAYEKLVSEIRRQVRALLKEDAIGFTKELATSDKFGDQFFGGGLNKDQGREIKRAFNKHADHQFLSTLDTVHWGLSPSALEKLKGKRRDEISATMTLPGDDFIAPFEYGLWVKGRITLATNNQDMLYSGFYGDYGPGYEGTEEEVSHRDRSSGRNKRPSTSKDYSGYKQLVHGNEFHEKMARKGLPYVLDKSTWNPASDKEHGTPTYNEALVDNWQPVGIVIKPGMGMLQAGPAVIRDLATKFGVPIYDTSRRILWSPS